MNPVQSSAIDLVAFVYDLAVHDDQWVPFLLEVRLPLFDHGLTAVDPKGIGLSLCAPRPAVTKLSGRVRKLWQMSGAHLVSGSRLRRGILEARASVSKDSALPLVI